MGRNRAGGRGADAVLKVPVGALFRRDGQWHAYVLANGRAQLRRGAYVHRHATPTPLHARLDHNPLMPREKSRRRCKVAELELRRHRKAVPA